MDADVRCARCAALADAAAAAAASRPCPSTLSSRPPAHAPLSSRYDLVNVFSVFLPQLLAYPEPTSPLNAEAGALLLRDPAGYFARAAAHARQHAMASEASAAAATAAAAAMPATPTTGAAAPAPRSDPRLTTTELAAPAAAPVEAATASDDGAPPARCVAADDGEGSVASALSDI